MFKNSVKRDMPPLYQAFTTRYIKNSIILVIVFTILGGGATAFYALIQGMMVMSRERRRRGESYE